MDTARFSIGEQDHIAFSVMHFYSGLPRALTIVVGTTVILAAIGFVAEGIEIVLPVAIGGFLGGCIVFGFVRFFAAPRHAKKAWREFTLFQEPIELTVHDEKFSIVQPSAHVEAAWKNMVKWDEDKSVFAIYVTQKQAYILPKAQIDPALIDYARTRLIESGLTAKRKKRK